MQVNGTALVTGASRGLGRAVTVELASRGFDVLATMRSPADGEGLAEQARTLPGRVSVARLDVNDPGSIEIPDDLSVLVNNAGMGDIGLLEFTEWEKIDAMIRGCVRPPTHSSAREGNSS